MRRRDFLKALVGGTAAALIGAQPRQIETEAWSKIIMLSTPHSKPNEFYRLVMEARGQATFPRDIIRSRLMDWR
ncbi:MAG: twin-arginine translocation signal domain-containing protein [Hyphomicrobiaceae bacterium]|nr:twin-arginine translocation signal domain-containing protein [Hyphomicrobiaceae bacterium]